MFDYEMETAMYLIETLCLLVVFLSIISPTRVSIPKGYSSKGEKN